MDECDASLINLKRIFLYKNFIFCYFVNSEFNKSFVMFDDLKNI